MFYYIRQLLEAAKYSKRPIINIIWETLKLRFYFPYLSISEYLAFRLYLNDLSFSEKATFCGHRIQATLTEMLVDEYSKFLAIDKVTTYFLLRSSSLPTPNIYAIYRSKRPSVLLNLSNSQELEAYLKKEGTLPIYFKRSSGSYGHGNVLATYLDGNLLHFGTNPPQPLRDFCKSLDDGGTLGWILQEPLTAHPSIAAFSGNDKISSVRIHTLLSNSGPKVFKAILRLNVGNLDYDNFEHGSNGNLLVAIDIKTGQATRLFSGIGIHQQINPLHPKIAKSFLGFQIPYWSSIVELVLEAHLLFPGYLCPAWDIAVCENGPTILEVNYFGDTDALQQAYCCGFLDPIFMNFLREQELYQRLFMTPKNRYQILTSSISSLQGHVGIKRGPWRW
jgi:hypothetical protein